MTERNRTVGRESLISPRDENGIASSCNEVGPFPSFDRLRKANYLRFKYNFRFECHLQTASQNLQRFTLIITLTFLSLRPPLDIPISILQYRYLRVGNTLTH